MELGGDSLWGNLIHWTYKNIDQGSFHDPGILCWHKQVLWTTKIREVAALLAIQVLSQMIGFIFSHWAGKPNKRWHLNSLMHVVFHVNSLSYPLCENVVFLWTWCTWEHNLKPTWKLYPIIKTTTVCGVLRYRHRGLVSLSSKLLHSCFTITSCQLTCASHVQNSVHSGNLYKHVMCMCVFVSTKNLRWWLLQKWAVRWSWSWPFKHWLSYNGTSIIHNFRP